MQSETKYDAAVQRADRSQGEEPFGSGWVPLSWALDAGANSG